MRIKKLSLLKKDTKEKKGDEWIFFLKAKCQMAKSLDVGLGQDLEVVICYADLKTSWYSFKKNF